MSFLSKIRNKYAVEGVGPDPSSSDLDGGSAHPDNWHTEFQSGKDEHHLRQEAKEFHDMVSEWNDHALRANDIFETLEQNGGLNFERYSPLILKGLSRKRLEDVAKIALRLARSVSIT